MTRRFAILAAITAPIVAATGCGYPAFSFGPGGTGGGSSSAATTSTSSAGTSSAASSSSSTTTSTSAGSGGGLQPCDIGHMVISEVRTRGPNGAADEFVELYNPTDAPIKLDGSWTLEALTLSSSPTGAYGQHWTGKGLTIYPHGHFLIVGSGFGDGIPYDDKLAVGLTDAASLRLLQNSTSVDALCYYNADDVGSASGFLNVLVYDCEGIAVGNPHNDTNATNTDSSLERKPGGTAGNCTDTDSNFDDFISQAPSTPENTKDAPAP